MDSYENTTKLIRLVAERPSLFNPGHERFFDRDYNARQWEEVAQELGFPSMFLMRQVTYTVVFIYKFDLENVVTKRWDYLRHELTRKKSGQGKEWVFKEHLSFLKDVIKPRCSISTLVSCIFIWLNKITIVRSKNNL